jgi:hypothetical protein
MGQRKSRRKSRRTERKDDQKIVSTLVEHTVGFRKVISAFGDDKRRLLFSPRNPQCVYFFAIETAFLAK